MEARLAWFQLAESIGAVENRMSYRYALPEEPLFPGELQQMVMVWVVGPPAKQNELNRHNATLSFTRNFIDLYHKRSNVVTKRSICEGLPNHFSAAQSN